MAEKIAVEEEGVDVEKKHHGCRTCCLTTLIVSLVIFCAAFGVGWYFGDKFTQESLGMSFGDTLGVLGDLYWTSDEDVVTNPYSSSDAQGFYNEIKRNVFLKDDAEVDFDAALAAAVDKYISGGTESSPAVAKPRNSSEGGEEGEDGSSITDIFTDMIAGVLNRDNIDVERLERYDENDPATDEYKFNLNDKQLAAFVNAILNTMLTNASGMDGLKDIASMIDLKSVLALKQIRFSARTENDVTVSTMASVTVWIGFQSAAGQALTSLMDGAGVGWLSWLARGFGNIILPENVYATISVPLYGEGDLTVALNDMDAEELARAYRLVDGILAMSGGEEPQTLDGLLKEFGEKIKPFLEQAGESIPLDKVENGTITIDLLDTVARMASKEEDAAPLTKSDFVYMLKAVMSDPAEQYRNIEPYRYESVYRVDGAEKYVAGGVEGQDPIDYEHEFVRALADAYSLDLDDGDSLTDVLALMGVSLDGATTPVDPDGIIARLNAEKLKTSLDADEAKKLYVTDRMLAAAFAEKLKTAVGNRFDMDLAALTFATKTDAPNHEFAMIAVEVDLAASLGGAGGGMMTELAAGLMPESILLTVYVDITQDGKLAEGDTHVPVEFKLNSCADTDRALAAIEKIAPSLSLDAMSKDIEDMLNKMLDQMFDKLKGMELKTTTYVYDGATDKWTGEGGSLVMPDVFTIVADLAIKDDGGEPVVSGAELRSVLKALNDTNGLPETPDISVNGETGKPDYSGFIADVTDKYYLEPKNGETLSTFDDLTSFMSSGAEGFDTSKLRVTGVDPAVRYLAYDNRVTTRERDNSEGKSNNLQPVMTAKQLGAFLQTEMNGNDSVKEYKIMKTRTGDNLLELVLAIGVKTLLPAKVNKLIVAQNIYVTATIKTNSVKTAEDGSKYYEVSTRVNNLEDGSKTYQDMLKVVESFSPDFDIEGQVVEIGKTMYEQMTELNTSLGGDSAHPFFAFEDVGLVMTDFYTFLANKMKLELTATRTSQTVKEAVQGMYVRSSVAGLVNTNNYVLSGGAELSESDKADVLLRNPAPADQNAWTVAEVSEFLAKSSTHSDISFNGFMKQVEKIDTAEQVRAVQTIILSKTNTTPAATAVRTWANKRVKSGITLGTDKDYLIVTFKLTMDKFMASDNSTLNQGLHPDEVYATVVYTQKTDGKFEQVDVIFNGMTADKFAVIQELMALKDESGDTSSDDKVNIVTISKEGTKVLDMLVEHGSVVFGGQLSEGEEGNETPVGIGSIAYTPKNSSES